MRLILVLATLLTCAGSAQNVRRIVSTAPSFTETLFALGAGERVVAVSPLSCGGNRKAPACG
jgi:ABC-type hemin transport system substrate-binding protein